MFVFICLFVGLFVVALCFEGGRELIAALALAVGGIVGVILIGGVVILVGLVRLSELL